MQLRMHPSTKGGWIVRSAPIASPSIPNGKVGNICANCASGSKPPRAARFAQAPDNPPGQVADPLRCGRWLSPATWQGAERIPRPGQGGGLGPAPFRAQGRRSACSSALRHHCWWSCQSPAWSVAFSACRAPFPAEGRGPGRPPANNVRALPTGGCREDRVRDRRAPPAACATGA